MPFASLKALQRLENIYIRITSPITSVQPPLGWKLVATAVALERVWVRKEGRVEEPRFLTLLLPSCCLAVRLQESKNFKKKDYFWQIMGQQDMFKSKVEENYFHGELSAQGLWQGLCFFRGSWRPQNLSGHHSLRTSAQHQPPCSTDQLPHWLPCVHTACPHKPPGAQRVGGCCHE